MNGSGKNVLETKLHRTNIPRKNTPTVQEITINRTGMARWLLAFLPDKE